MKTHATQDFTKVVRLGHDPSVGSTFCKIEFKAGRLSITGVEGPTRSGDCEGGCGQIVNHGFALKTYAPGWDADKVERFREIWDAWHLNDMRAGTPKQTEWLRAHKADYKPGEVSYYKWARAVLGAAGLNPDGGYEYGSEWLRVEVPADVVEWLAELPDADTNPAWV